jgi:excisionase family DNA binding protein
MPDSEMKLIFDRTDDHAARVIPGHTELTTSDISELLNVSRAFAIRLLDEGQIPSQRVGTRRRARREDVLDYRDQHYKVRKAILDQISEIDQEFGLT